MGLDESGSAVGGAEDFFQGKAAPWGDFQNDLPAVMATVAAGGEAESFEAIRQAGKGGGAGSDVLGSGGHGDLSMLVKQGEKGGGGIAEAILCHFAEGTAELWGCHGMGG
jgi:hypothetical protein